MIIGRRIAVVGSREFKNYAQLSGILKEYLLYDDEIVSGGAIGADSMAQRWAKENGHAIYIIYPRWENGKSAGFARNRRIVENSEIVLAFYSKGRFRVGGTANSIDWAKKFGKPYIEFEENVVNTTEELHELWQKIHSNTGG